MKKRYTLANMGGGCQVSEHCPVFFIYCLYGINFFALLNFEEICVVIVTSFLHVICCVYSKKLFHMISTWIEQMNCVTKLIWNSGELSLRVIFVWNIHIKFLLIEFHVNFMWSSELKMNNIYLCIAQKLIIWNTVIIFT